MVCASQGQTSRSSFERDENDVGSSTTTNLFQNKFSILIFHSPVVLSEKRERVSIREVFETIEQFVSQTYI